MRLARIGLVALAVCAFPALAAASPALDAVREGAGRAPLRPSPALEAVAAEQARHIARTGRISHKGPRGGSVGVRARRSGYAFCTIAENVAAGRMSEREVMRAWAQSRGHRRNLLNARVTEYGLADVGGRVWVLVLGRPGC